MRSAFSMIASLLLASSALASDPPADAIAFPPEVITNIDQINWLDAQLAEVEATADADPQLAVTRYRLLTTHLLLALALLLTGCAELNRPHTYVYPMAGQSLEQQVADYDTCERWAGELTGYDAVGAAITGGASGMFEWAGRVIARAGPGEVAVVGVAVPARRS